MDYAGALQDASYAIQSKIGAFLQTGSIIKELRSRADVYRSTTNATVNNMAQAAFNRASGLLAQFDAIEKNATKMLTDAAAMREKMAKDPLWASIIAGTTSSFGWATVTAANNYIGSALNLTQQLGSLAGQIDAHMDDVAELKDDEGKLENFAAGKGIKAALSDLSNVGSGVLSGMGDLKWILGGAAVIYGLTIFGPAIKSILPKGSK